MIKQILFLAILILGFSFDSNREESNIELSVVGLNSTDKGIMRNIRFDFSAERINTFQEVIEIKASLFNNNIDTIYFLSSTCDGEQYSLRYDTTKFVFTPIVNCNASNPRIIKIAPKGQHNFKAHFKRSRSSKETKIKLGFDFYSVDKSFDLTNKNLGDINIFNRPKDKQTILWANEKTIK